jgi:hypothetical protein
MRKYRNSDGHSDRAVPHKLTWRDVLEGHLVDLLSSTYDGEGQLAEAEIQGKPLEVYDSPKTPAFTGSKADDVADEVAKLLCDQMRNAAEGGLAVTFKLAARNHRVDQATDDRKLGGIQAELAATLRRSSKLKATLAKRHSIPENRSAKRAAWLGRSSRTAADGRPEFDPGSAFNLKTAVSIWRIFERYIAGDSLEQIRQYLEDARLPPPGVSSKPLAIGRKVHPWQVEMVNYQLHSAAAIGLHHGAEINLHSPHPPQPVNPAILSWRTFRLVQDLLSTPLSGGRPNAANLLSGRIFCLRCRGDGRDRQPMESATRSSGKQLLCGHAKAAHMGPPYDAFETELLHWLQKQENIEPELDQLLAATDEQLRTCMEAFAWPPSDATSPDSLEEAVREHQRAKANKSTTSSLNPITEYMEKLKSERMEQKREAMRRKMRNVLRRHIDHVYVGDRAPGLVVQEREAVPLLYSQDTIFDSDGEFQRGLGFFNVVVHRVGRDAPDPAFLVALSVGSFEMPRNTDWEKILLNKQEEEPESPRSQAPSKPGDPLDPDESPHDGESGVHGPSSSGHIRDSQASATGRSTTNTSASSIGKVEWTGYQPHSMATASLPCGVHIRGEDLDELGDEFYRMGSSVQPTPWAIGKLSINEADYLAFEMLRCSLEFFARFDLWLLEVLKSSVETQDVKKVHQLIFGVACPSIGDAIDLESFWDTDEQEILGRRVINRIKGSAPGLIERLVGNETSATTPNKWKIGELRKKLKKFQDLLGEFPTEKGSLHLMMCTASHLEGVRWALESDRRSAGSPWRWARTMQVLMCCPIKEYFLANPFSVHFETDKSWEWLTSRLSAEVELKLQPNLFGVLRAFDHRDLRAALQAKTFPPAEIRSAEPQIYLHGNGRSVRAIRADLGIP